MTFIDTLLSKDSLEVLKLFGGIAGLLFAVAIAWRIATGNMKFIQFGKVKIQMDENGNPIEKKAPAKRKLIPRKTSTKK